ncbi:hypothetical protein RFI_14997 [Reticulomyxa filosa]|uniref:Uncharacterized protein n=1 Tax=Reticulomyxa filosa TaxID=46433 RepID=X6N8W9_RETFI|nr:hypothetical protein RFI_14997 [Reticulomyxa filosa]|eukprot:ETO22204.1 hypothetical protein RFI_14997 [Reticulomyxa filosa]
MTQIKAIPKIAKINATNSFGFFGPKKKGLKLYAMFISIIGNDKTPKNYQNQLSQENQLAVVNLLMHKSHNEAQGSLLRDCGVNKEMVDISDWYDVVDQPKQYYLALAHIVELCKTSHPSKQSGLEYDVYFRRPKDIAQQRWFYKTLGLLYDYCLLIINQCDNGTLLYSQIDTFAIHVYTYMYIHICIRMYLLFIKVRKCLNKIDHSNMC